MSTINQKIKQKHLKKKQILKKPQIKGLCTHVFLKTPKKPNSALRKVIKVQLTNLSSVFAHVPGEGHNLIKFSTVLIRFGRTKDLPGFKYKAIRGKYDLQGVKNRKQSRSKYGVKL